MLIALRDPSDPSRPREIEPEVTDVAIALGRLLLSNTVAAFGIMQKPEKIEHAEKLLAWIRRHRCSEFSVRKRFAPTNPGSGKLQL